MDSEREEELARLRRMLDEQLSQVANSAGGDRREQIRKLFEGAEREGWTLTPEDIAFGERYIAGEVTVQELVLFVGKRFG